MAKLNYIVTATSHVTTRSIFVSIVANWSGTPQARVYKDGDTPPAFSNMTVATIASYQAADLEDGIYVVEFKDNNGEKQLCKIKILADHTETCYDEFEGSFIFQISLTDTKLSVTSFVGTWPDHTASEAQTAAARAVALHPDTVYKSLVYTNPANTFASGEWTNTELETKGFTKTIDEIRLRRGSDSCTDTLAYEVNLLHTFDQLTAGFEKTNATAVGADDGTITLSVDGGSGEYEFEWADGPTTQNRSSLAPGFYTVTITDLITGEEIVFEDIQITEPAIDLTQGSILQVPTVNSLHFVVDPITPDYGQGLQALDNVLFEHQRYPGYTKSKYFQKVAKADSPAVQFNSDFPSHTVDLYDYCTGERVKSIPHTLSEQNVGKTEDHAIRIENHSEAGKSRVYFQVGVPPVPVTVGDTFEILDNEDGFDGIFTIVAIETDAILDVQYLVINKTYDAGSPTSNATGRFVNSSADFNVYEFTLDVSDVDDGKYYVKIVAFDDDSEKVAISEPILVKTEHRGTTVIECRNFDNAFDVTWATGFTAKIRVESLIGHKRSPGGERSTSRNSDYSLVKTAAKKSRILTFETFMLPPYLHEKLAVVFDLDYFSINGVEFQTLEGYSEPQYLYRSLLANSSIKVEQVAWFRKYNSDDIGTVVEDGLIESDGGFIKST